MGHKVSRPDYAKKFHKSELSLLDSMFRDLASRSQGATMDKATFLALFNLPGMVGERLFAVFDRKKLGVIDYEEFISGLALYCKGSMEEKLRLLFQMYDLTGDGHVDRIELSTMLHSLINSPTKLVAKKKDHNHHTNREVKNEPHHGQLQQLHAQHQQQHHQHNHQFHQQQHQHHPYHHHLQVQTPSSAIHHHPHYPSSNHHTSHHGHHSGTPTAHTPGVHHTNESHFFVGPTSSPPASASPFPDSHPPMTTSASVPSSFAPGSPTTHNNNNHKSASSVGWEHPDTLAAPSTPAATSLHLRRSPTPLIIHPPTTGGTVSSSASSPTAASATAASTSTSVYPKRFSINGTVPPPMLHTGSTADLHHLNPASGHATPMGSFASLAPAPLTISTSHRGSRDGGDTSAASTPIHGNVHHTASREHHATSHPAPLSLISPSQAEYLSHQVPGSPATFPNHHTSLPNSAASTPHHSGTPPMLHTPSTIHHHQQSQQQSSHSVSSPPQQQQQTVEDIVDEAFRTCALTHDGELSFQEFVKFTQQTPSVIEALERVFVLNYWNDIKHPTKKEAQAYAHHPHAHHPATHANHHHGSSSPHPHALSINTAHHTHDRPGTPVQPLSPTVPNMPHSQSVPTLARPSSGNALSSLVNSSSRSSGLTKKKSVDHGTDHKLNLVEHVMTHGTPTHTPAHISHANPNNNNGGTPIHTHQHQHGTDEDSGPRLPAMQCGSCGWRLRFCHKCGGELPLTATLAGLSCDKCGKLWKDWGFCMQCGGKLPQLTGVPEEPVPPQPYDFPNNQVGLNLNPEDAYKEGPLFKKGARLKQWQERWFVFRSNFLYMFRSASALQPHKVWFLEGCFIEVSPEADEKHGYYPFEVINSHREKKIFYARTADDRMEWVKTLRKGAHSFPIQEFYNVGKQIGKGRFSVVHSATHLRTGKTYAIKVIDKSKIAVDAREKEALRTEIAILKLVRHPTIIHMQEIFEAPSKLYIVMTLLRGGDLFDRIIARKRFPERTCMIILWRLLSAVKYLHDRGIVHRDLKPENILCGDEKDDTRVLIADFGLSKFASPEEVMNLPCGTLAYVAPEVLKLQGYSKAVDLWSLGVILYLLLRGGLPFDGKAKNEIIERTLHAKLSFRHEVWKTVSKNAIDLITRLLDKSPATRITIEAATAHPWFASLTDEDKEIEEMDYDDTMMTMSHNAAIATPDALSSGASSGATSPAFGSPNLGPGAPTGAVPAPLIVTTSGASSSHYPPSNGGSGNTSVASSPTGSGPATRFATPTPGANASSPAPPPAKEPSPMMPNATAMAASSILLSAANTPMNITMLSPMAQPRHSISPPPVAPSTPGPQAPPNMTTPPPSLVTHTAQHIYPAIAAALSAAYQSPLIVTPSLATLASAPTSPSSSPSVATRTISNVFHTSGTNSNGSGGGNGVTAIALPPVVVITATPHAQLVSATPSSPPVNGSGSNTPPLVVPSQGGAAVASTSSSSTTTTTHHPTPHHVAGAHSRTSSLIASGGVGLSFFTTPPDSVNTTPFASAPASPYHTNASTTASQHGSSARSPTPSLPPHHPHYYQQSSHMTTTTINPHLHHHHAHGHDSPLSSPAHSPISSRSPSPSPQVPGASSSSSASSTATTATPSTVVPVVAGVTVLAPPPAFLFASSNTSAASSTSTSPQPMVISFAVPTRSMTPVGTSTINSNSSSAGNSGSSSVSSSGTSTPIAPQPRLFGHRSLPGPLTFTVPIIAPVVMAPSSSASTATTTSPSAPPSSGRFTPPATATANAPIAPSPSTTSTSSAASSTSSK